MSWTAIKGNANGVLVEGDKKAAPTRWWNHLFLLWFGWPMRAVLSHTSSMPVRVGFRDYKGKTMLRNEVVSSNKFVVRIGHEDCTFFAIARDGKEVPLKHVGTFHKTSLQAFGKSWPLI